MRVHISSMFIILLGILIAFSSYLRWFILFHDPSNAFFGMSFGIGLVLFAILYNYNRNNDEWKEKVEQRLMAHTSTKFGMEKEDMENIAKGYEVE